jgi:hypothetical protein
VVTQLSDSIVDVTFISVITPRVEFIGFLSFSKHNTDAVPEETLPIYCIPPGHPESSSSEEYATVYNTLHPRRYYSP